MQIPREISTALNACYYRAKHYAHDTPRIFSDPIAHLMLRTSEDEFIAERLIRRLEDLDPGLAASCADRSEMLSYSMRATAPPAETLSRARYAEDKLEQAINRDVKQYVLLGSGMDTFAFRRPDLNQRLQVFEVDREEALTFKRQRLVEAGLKEPGNLHFVSIDFAQESLDTALARSVYDPNVPTFFGWLGVTMFLDHDTVFDALNAIMRVATARSHVVFDYLDTDAFDPSRSSKAMQELMENIRNREPLLAGFEPVALEDELSNIGFQVRENLSPDDIQERYFRERNDGYHATDHAHFIWAVVE